MPQYLVLKVDEPAGPRITQTVTAGKLDNSIVEQGYVGDGRYAVLEWDARTEYQLAAVSKVSVSSCPIDD